MGDFTIWFNRSIFSEDVIARTAHRYTNFFHITVHGTASEIGVVLVPHEGVELPVNLEARFKDDALDERLRQIVREETKDLHAELIRAALRESLPRHMDTVP